MAKAEATTVRVEREGAVATVTLDRPEAMNAQTRESRAELQEALRGVARDREVRAVVLTGAGRGFCAGQDLREEGALEGVGDTVRKGYVPIIRAITGMEKPVIAAVNGAAAGAGLSFALACDYRFMAEEAFAMMAFSNIALVPDSGGSWFLPRTIGYERAFELAATGRRVSAAEALELGIAQRVVPGDQLHGRGRGLRRPARRAPAAGAGLDEADDARRPDREPGRDDGERGAAAGGRGSHRGPRRGRRLLPREAPRALHRCLSGPPST